MYLIIFFVLITIILLFLLSSIFGTCNETFKSKKKKIKYHLPHGNSNTKQTHDLTKKLLINGSQANADAKFDSDVGSINNINPPTIVTN